MRKLTLSIMIQKLLTITFFVLLSGCDDGRGPEGRPSPWKAWNDFQFGNNLETWILGICVLIFVGGTIMGQLDKKNKKDK